jgi:hypothetical protein
MYDKGRKAGFLERRLLPIFKSVGRFGLIGLALTYPLYLVYVGVAYGGLAFWSFLVGSMAIIGLVLWKLGFASHYSSWDIGFKRMVGAVAGFVVAMGFYMGLIYAKTWMLPISFALLGVGVFIILRRSRL